MGSTSGNQCNAMSKVFCRYRVGQSEVCVVRWLIILKFILNPFLFCMNLLYCGGRCDDGVRQYTAYRWRSTQIEMMCNGEVRML